MTKKQTSAATVPSKKPLDEKSMIRKMSLASIIGNTLLSSFKLFAGIFGKSNAMISDAVHSMSDVLTTFIALIGIRISKKGADEKHPYGHERLECVASVILGALLAVTGILIGKAGIETIIGGNYSSLQTPGLIALIAAISSIVVKEWMYWYTRHYAKKLNSSVFMADAWHHRSDAFSSVGSLIGIAGAMLGFPVMDAIASLVICIFIIKVSFDIIKNAIVKMIDTSCGKAYEEKLGKYISEQEGVLGIDVLRTRKFGDKVYVDLEIRMDGEQSLESTHDKAEKIHENMEKDFPEIKHVMIHVNPQKQDDSSTESV